MKKGKGKRKRKKERNPVPDRSPKGTPTPAAYIHSDPALTSPTLALLKKVRTASVYRSSDKRSLIDVLLGLARACLTL